MLDYVLKLTRDPGGMTAADADALSGGGVRGPGGFGGSPHDLFGAAGIPAKDANRGGFGEGRNEGDRDAAVVIAANSCSRRTGGGARTGIQGGCNVPFPSLRVQHGVAWLPANTRGSEPQRTLPPKRLRGSGGDPRPEVFV